MTQEPSQSELILQCVRLVQKLRSGVGQVFKDLADGVNESSEETQSKEESDSQSRTNGSGPSKDGKGAITKTLKRSLETISSDFSELEKTGANLGSVQLFSNIDNLSLDPVDKNAVMHSQLLQSYKWTNKMHGLASQAFIILSQNSMKRTQTPKFTNVKKQKVNMLAACTVPPGLVDQFVASLDQGHADMTITMHRPLGSCGIMQIELGRTLRAVVVLRGMVIEYVKVKAFDETFKTEDGQIDVWSTSRYHVFQKVTDHAEAASLHYYAPAMPQLAIKSFVLWLQGFKTLFSAPCLKCGKFLQNNLPPTWRDFRNREPFHDVCRT